MLDMNGTVSEVDESAIGVVTGTSTRKKGHN
jgi:hypothetical protein